MTDDPRVDQLLEELLESGGSPEEACRTCPELLPQVRAGWQRLRALEAEVGALFPESTFIEGATPPSLPTTNLPRIRGYEVQAVLGRGGMGIVYKAWHRRLNRAVALKMLLAGAYAGPQELERFLREAEAVAGLRHANVVQVHDVGDLDGRPYFTMEFVEGGSLAQKLAGAPQPAGQAAALVATIAEAIQVAHRSGIVHRDLTPANILLTADGTPKISDFGLARRLEDGGGLTVSGVPMGTPSYMAPEQAQGNKDAIGPGVDVYALGAILYEMLTGRPPFRAETAAETVQQVIFQDPVPPSRLNPKVPRDLETICLQCLHKEAARRYASAAALADDLQSYLHGEAITARPEGRLERLARWVRRRPALTVGLAGGLLLATALVGGGLWVRWEQSESERAKTRLDRVDQDRRDQQLVARLDAIRLERSDMIIDGAIDFRANKARADQDYETAFREAGFGQVSDDPDTVGARVAASNIRKALLIALDDWAFCAADKQRYHWVLAVARQADPDASNWRDRVRDPAIGRNPAALAELAREARVADESVVLLLGLGEQLERLRSRCDGLSEGRSAGPPVRLLCELVARHRALQKGPGREPPLLSGRGGSAPGEFVPLQNLGRALLANGQVDEAIACFRGVVDLAPTNAAAYASLGHALSRKGRHDAAVQELRQAVDLNPQSADFRARLGQSLLDFGRVDEAIAEAREAVRIDPTFVPGHNVLGTALFNSALQKKPPIICWRRSG